MTADNDQKPAGPASWRIPKWFPELGDELLNKLKLVHGELIYFNGKINLISPRTETAADQIHFADSILASRHILESTEQTEIYDFGAGNGLPGMILALLDSKRKVHLVDTDARKIEYMKHCIHRAGLANCDTIHARVEDLGQEKVACAVTRAMASISKTLLIAHRVAAKGAIFYHMKGHNWTREVAEIPAQVISHWELLPAKDYRLPETEMTMTVIGTKKIS